MNYKIKDSTRVCCLLFVDSKEYFFGSCSASHRLVHVIALSTTFSTHHCSRSNYTYTDPINGPLLHAIFDFIAGQLVETNRKYVNCIQDTKVAHLEGCQQSYIDYSPWFRVGLSIVIKQQYAICISAFHR